MADPCATSCRHSLADMKPFEEVLAILDPKDKKIRIDDEAARKALEKRKAQSEEIGEKKQGVRVAI